MGGADDNQEGAWEQAETFPKRCWRLAVQLSWFLCWHPGCQRVWGTGGIPPVSGITTLSRRNFCTTAISQPGLPTLSCAVNGGCPPQNWGMQEGGSLLEELQASPEHLCALPPNGSRLGSRGHQHCSPAFSQLCWQISFLNTDGNEKIQAQAWPSLERQRAPL